MTLGVVNSCVGGRVCVVVEEKRKGWQWENQSLGPGFDGGRAEK